MAGQPCTAKEIVFTQGRTVGGGTLNEDVLAGPFGA